MAFDYRRYFDEIAVIRDLTNMPEEAKWRTSAPAQDGGRGVKKRAGRRSGQLK